MCDIEMRESPGISVSKKTLRSGLISVPIHPFHLKLSMKNYIRKRENMDITSLYHDIATHEKNSRHSAYVYLWYYMGWA